jgi:hypothetical protein
MFIEGPGLVQPVDVVLDVLRGVLAAHDSGGRVLELTPVRDHGLPHRELGVLARVVDVVMCVEDPADVADLHAVPRQLASDRHLLRDDSSHAEPLHDLRVAGACVDNDRVELGAEDEVAPGLHPGADPHVAGEDEEARLELDVDQIEHLDLVGHRGSLLSRRSIRRAGRNDANTAVVLWRSACPK